MATVKKAKLFATGTKESLTMTVEADLDWDRGDDRVDWDLQIRFMGRKTLRADRIMHVHNEPVSPGDGKSRRIDVSGAGGVFDSDRGRDEIYAEVQLAPRATDVRVVKTNTVRGDFDA
ncbi:hypothetical protein BH23ACT9_BH23ACT9_01570 [soil metagenome]